MDEKQVLLHPRGGGLLGIFFEVAEESAFMFGEGVGDEELGWPGATVWEIRLEFSGATPAGGSGGASVAGEARLALTAEAALEIAANMIGTECGDPEAALLALDSAGELLNVFCGNAFAALFGRHAAIELGAPRAARLGERGWSRLARKAGTLALRLDSHPVLLGLCLESRCLESLCLESPCLESPAVLPPPIERARR